MTPDAAYDYVKSIRPRVLLASSQWQVRVKSVSAIIMYYYFLYPSALVPNFYGHCSFVLPVMFPIYCDLSLKPPLSLCVDNISYF